MDEGRVHFGVVRLAEVPPGLPFLLLELVLDLLSPGLDFVEEGVSLGLGPSVCLELGGALVVGHLPLLLLFLLLAGPLLLLLDLFLGYREDPRLLEHPEAVVFHLALPGLGLEEGVAGEVDLEALDHLQGLQLPEVPEQVAGEVEVAEVGEGHEVVEAPLQRVVGKVERPEGGDSREVLERPQVALADDQVFERFVAEEEGLGGGWEEPELDGADHDGAGVLG